MENDNTIKLGLALKYRPKTFAELCGQKHVSAVLRNAIVRNNVPQQLLFSGGSGLGKTTVARIATAAILCETPLADRVEGDACGRCESCLDISTPFRIHPDLIEFDAASHGGKEDIKEIASKAALAPLRGKVKVYIIDEAHGLSGPGGQAFLKLLEEPPAHVIFMLATTDPDKMLKTNRGRCTEFSLFRPTDDEIITNLNRVAAGEGWTLSSRVATSIISATDPDLGMRGILMTLEKLSLPLSKNVDPDLEELTMLLGSTTALGIEDLTSSIESGNKQEALSFISLLRKKVSDSAIREALLTWSKNQLLSSLENPSQKTLVDQWRYETILSMPSGSSWTEVLVLKLADLKLSPPEDVLLVAVEQAESKINELEKTLTIANKTLTEAIAQNKEAEVLLDTMRVAFKESNLLLTKAQSAEKNLLSLVETASAKIISLEAKLELAAKSTSSQPSENSSSAFEKKAKADDILDSKALAPKDKEAKSVAAEDAALKNTISTNVAFDAMLDKEKNNAPHSLLETNFFNALYKRSEAAFLLVKKCQYEITPDSVLLIAPIALIAELRTVASDLRAAAGAVGLPLKVHQTSD